MKNPALENPAPPPDDVAAFIALLRERETGYPALEKLFKPERPLYIARAPGRLDLMGGIADYSGALVLQWPLREATLVALQKSNDAKIRVVSLGAAENGRSLSYRMPLSLLRDAGGAVGYETARAHFAQDPKTQWAAYVVGCLLVLMHTHNVAFDTGVNILVSSQVPEGKGVSSSAALEVATMQALNGAYGLDLPAEEVARLCQLVEHEVVGAPCGIMDQMASSCGRAGKLMALRCQPAALQGFVGLPAPLQLWGIDSGVRHAVSGSAYRTVRTGTFMGYRILEQHMGTPVESTGPGRVVFQDPVWANYLANVTPSMYASITSTTPLPKTMTGRAFLAQYQGIHDTVTTVHPEETYPLRYPVEHAIYEQHRVEVFERLLNGTVQEADKVILGELMYQSNASYTRCGLGSEETEAIVDKVRQLGPPHGLFGAKITGGGSGGTVAILGDASAQDAVAHVAASRYRETGRHPHVFSGTSPGAGFFGTLKLEIS